MSRAVDRYVREGLLGRVVVFGELVAIVAALVMSVGVVVEDRLERARLARDIAEPVVDAPSACDGGSGALALLHAYLEGADLPAEPSAAEPAMDPPLRARGAALYERLCATCHGQRGDGNGPTARLLKDPPAAFATGTYELRTTEHEALPTDLDMFHTITRGIHGSAMPPWFALPERDRWALVAHLKSLSKQFEEDVAPPPVEPQPPAETHERISHGFQLYTTAGCASCHGASGRGDGPAARSLHYSSGFPVAPRDFVTGQFHRTSRLRDIYLTIATGLDGTPMASFSKVMTPADLWDVAMYVHSLAPPMTERASGLRCPSNPIASRETADELVGIRTIVHSLDEELR